MVESLVLGYKALEIAAIHAFNEDEEDAKDAAAKDGVAGGGAAADCAEQAEPAKRDGVAETVSHVCGRDADVTNGQMSASNEPAFSWKDDFSRPDTMIDALGAQQGLEVVSEPSQPSEAKAASAPAAEDDAVFGKKEMAVSMVLGLVMGVVLFIVAPAFITNLLVGEYDSNTLAWNVVDGILRMAVFVFYIWLIRAHERYQAYVRIPRGRAQDHPLLRARVAADAGKRAAVSAVACVAANVSDRGDDRHAIFVYTITPLNGLISAWGVPDGAPEAGAGHCGAHRADAGDCSISYAHRALGGQPSRQPADEGGAVAGFMQMQYLTTNEADDGMPECAIAAMKQVLEREQEAAKRQALLRASKKRRYA